MGVILKFQPMASGVVWRALLAVVLLCALIVPSLFAQDCILALRQNGKGFTDAFRGLNEELEDDFTVRELIIDKKTSVHTITAAMKKFPPRLVVLMDNVAIRLYRSYQQTLGEQDTVVPSVSLMGVMVRDAIADLKNATGISYEIPIVTSAVSLRSVLAVPFTKIGVVHREFLSGFIEENRMFCEREGIEILSEVLPNTAKTFKGITKKAVTNLINKRVDALWIPNDNVLLHPGIIKSVWLPLVQKYKVPVIVGVEVLVNPQINLGTFAVLPDHVALGTQAAEIVFAIMENGWSAGDLQVDQPLAIHKIINLRLAKRYSVVRDDRLSTFDKILK